MIAQAWDSISGSTLHVSWNKILGYNEKCVNHSVDCDTLLHKCTINTKQCEKDCTTVKKMFKKFMLLRDGIKQWLADNDTPLFKTSTDDGKYSRHHSEAHSCHKATFKWMELQKAAQLTLIRHIHDVAAQNKLSSFKQKLITDYIEYDSN
ncbi:hypothetical protein T12_1475 [Trichinella patagoniensis]|uniref:Uncharacterized protein n=1 Tax=Trichinella patagoniensis TaxID=990121 RepID=A0A0V0Z7X0_9BILA|nr:hypothetical protein T12_1475 [Trichinella patagoniensis]